MKNLFVLILGISPLFCFSQKPVFKALISPNLHAGCYIGSQNNIVANLSEEDGKGNPIAFFNFNGADSAFSSIKGTKSYPDAYQNGEYQVFVKNTLLKKDKNSCFEYHLYDIKVVYKGKSYYYQKKGHCGC